MIVGALAWYDEPAEVLAASVAGFAQVCDQIVAVDGAYALYPHGRPRSLPEQGEAILLAAEAAGTGCLVHRPRDVFYGNEVGKRNLTLALAEAFEPDWVVVFDGDFVVSRCLADSVRHDLETTSMNVATYGFGDRHGMARFRGIYRWTPDLRYGNAHWDVRGSYDGKELRLREDGPAVDVALEVTHRERGAARKAAAARYAQVRDAQGVEHRDRMPELVA